MLCAALAFSGEAMSQRGDILDCQEFANEIPSLIRDGCWIKDEEHKPACENAYRQATSEILSWCNGNVRRCDEQRRAVLDREGMAYPFNVTWGLHGWSPSMGGPRWNVKCFHAAVYPKAGSASPNSQQPREASQPEVRKKPTRSTVRRVQADLARLGYKPGPADGIAGRRTAAAVKRFQSASGLPADGVISPALVKQLRAKARAAQTKETPAQPRPEKAQAASKETSAAAPAGKAGGLWSALAVSQNPGGGYAWGIAWNAGGRAAAKRRAVRECRDAGGKNCREGGSFKSSCSALAVGDGAGWGSGGGDTPEKAAAAATAKCGQYTDNCEVVVSRCSDTAGDAGGVAAKAPERKEPVLPFEPKCDPHGAEPGCWFEVSNKPGCHIRYMRHQMRCDNFLNPWADNLSWTGSCSRGIANGQGTIKYPGGYFAEGTGMMVNGYLHGSWTLTTNDMVRVDKGSFSEGCRHGHWVERYPDANIVEKGRYVDGKRHGPWVRRSPEYCSKHNYSHGELQSSTVTEC